ncbi:MAG: DNA repair exonuclease [Clostridia bacterium]|nr:DNA repair exonuclease [Clostridia bacterium]
MLKILHCGDIHLDSPFSLLDHEESVRRREELRRTFLEMLAFARREGVALILIAGDLFDHGFATAETLNLLNDAFSAMADCKFVISPGNHDAAIAGSAYLSKHFPDNVTVFTEEALSFVDYDDLGIRVWGYGFTSDRCEVSPLAGHVLTTPGKTALLCAHAELGVPLSKYAPLSAADLETSGLAYAALGHIHMPPEPVRCGNTLAAYSGCLVGRSYDECGFGGAVLVGIEDGHVAAWERIPFAHRRYCVEPLSLDGVSSDAEVISALTAMIAQAKYGEETALRVILSGAVDTAYTPDLAAISAAGKQGLWQLDLLDRTTPIWGSDYLERDPSIRGALYRELLPAMQTGTPEERSRAVAALRLGLAALDGRL